MFRIPSGKSPVGENCEAVCGDGMVVSPEQCDDGNSNSGKLIIHFPPN